MDAVLIRNATIVTLDPRLGDLEDADIAIGDGRIIEVGHSLVAPDDATVIDADGMIAIPGLIDTHDHCWNSLLKGLVEENDRLDYYVLKRLFGPAYRPSDTYRAVRLALLEAIWSGITTVHDWDHNARGPEDVDAALQAHRDVPIRARFSYGTPEGDRHDETMDLADVRRVAATIAGTSSDGLLRLGVALRGPWRSDAEVRSKEVEAARELQLPITIHFTRLEKDSVRAADLLEREGLIAPDVQLVHSIGTTERERDAFARHGVHVSVSPISEMRGAMGFAPIVEMRRSGVNVSLSLDTPSLAGNCDMFSTMRTGMYVERSRYGDQSILSPRDMLEMATIGGARDLGIQDLVGTISPGKQADITLVSTRSLTVAPAADAVHLIVHSATPSDVDSVLVNGRVVKRHGSLVDLDADAAVDDANEALRELEKRVGWDVGNADRPLSSLVRPSRPKPVVMMNG